MYIYTFTNNALDPIWQHTHKEIHLLPTPTQGITSASQAQKRRRWAVPPPKAESHHSQGAERCVGVGVGVGGGWV